MFCFKSCYCNVSLNLALEVASFTGVSCLNKKKDNLFSFMSKLKKKNNRCLCPFSLFWANLNPMSTS